MSGNKSLGDAKSAKKDEFYTQLCDIEAELKHYTRFFKGKTVLCNCDDPYESNFFYYFASRFNDLGLKRTLPEVGIDETHFATMAMKSVGGDTLPGFKALKQEDVENIFKMCMK